MTSHPSASHTLSPEYGRHAPARYQGQRTKDKRQARRSHGRRSRDTEPEFTSAFAQHGTVTLLVGAEEESLVAHESYLTRNSEFFKAAIKKEWAEGQARVIKFPEDDLETMTNYLTFTYSGTLPTSRLVEGCPIPTDAAWNSLAELYILGDLAFDKCVRHAVVCEIVRISMMRDEHGHMHFMGTAASNMLFEFTPEQSPIRRLIIHEYVSRGKKD
ncbi:hypothetical protein MBLNU13_g04977t1 [Cladosporium sp. NU13]